MKENQQTALRETIEKFFRQKRNNTRGECGTKMKKFE